MSSRRFETAPAMAGAAPARHPGHTPAWQPDQTQAWRRGPPASGGATVDGHQRLDLAGALLLRLQRERGNRYVQRVVALGRQGGPASGVGVPRAKLALGPPRDRYEREADQVARRVAGRPVQDAPERQDGQERSDGLDHLGEAGWPSGIQRLHGGPAGAVDATVERDVGKARGGGQAVPDALRSRAERALGADLDAVRIHTGARVDRLNEALGSHAFTVGSDVFVHRFRYRPGTRAGDELLGHELTHTVQQGASRSRGAASGTPSPSVPTVQRLFGFELELGVPLTSGLAGELKPPEINPSPTERPSVKVGEAEDRSFDVHVDHSGRLNNIVPRSARPETNAPIIELVTRPMDEFNVTADQVRGVMNGVKNVAQSIRTRALDRNARAPLDTIDGVRADPAWRNFVGIREDASKQSVQSVDAYVQQTYGLSLRRVPNEFEQRTTQPGSLFKRLKRSEPGSLPTTTLRATKEALEYATMTADDLMEWLKDERNRAIPAADVPVVRGFFTLVAYYLWIGALDPKQRGLMKNRTGIFFYKTKLSTLWSRLAGDIAELSFINDASDSSERDQVVKKLIELAGRTATEDVLPDRDVTCGTWLDEVLSGTDDKMFAKAKNPWSPELEAPDVGRGTARGLGVVLENREFAWTEGRTGDKRHYAPSEWADMAVRLWQRLRDLQGR